MPSFAGRGAWDFRPCCALQSVCREPRQRYSLGMRAPMYQPAPLRYTDPILESSTPIQQNKRYFTEYICERITLARRALAGPGEARRSLGLGFYEDFNSAYRSKASHGQDEGEGAAGNWPLALPAAEAHYSIVFVVGYGDYPNGLRY